MNSLAITDYIKQNGIESLTEDYGIKAIRHSVYPNLILFKYGHVASDFSKKFVCQARGIILDEANYYNIVNYSFKKFFNSQEGCAANLDWSSVQVEEKLDGSLIQLYNYNNNWEIATSGSPDASGFVGNNGLTFKDLFLNTINQLNIDYSKLLKGYCYAFELRTKFNRIVVPVNKPSISIICIRKLDTLEEINPFNIDPKEFGLQDFSFPKIIKFNNHNLEDIVKSANNLSPDDSEGYVVKDKYFNRIKVKSLRYVELHHAISYATPKSVLEVVRQGEGEELLSYFPELKELYEDIKLKYNNLLEETISVYNSIKHVEEQKDFAKEALRYKFNGALFAVRSNKCSIEEYYKDRILKDSLSNLLGL